VTTTYWDPRAARTVAAAEADARRADAEARRAETALQLERARLELDAERAARAEAARAARATERAERRRARAEARAARRAARRAALGGVAAAVRARVPALVGMVAIGSPMLIAWQGQLEFARTVMQLGAASIALPVSLEGAVLYSAYLAGRAVAAGLPAGRYRAMTWAMMTIAAVMNAWHQIDAGNGLHVGVIYALASIVGIVLWELTTCLGSHVRSGRSGAEIRAAFWRRIRYPRLSWAAASIRAARGPACSQDEAWHAAWVDRYGVGPDVPRRDRRLAALIVRATAKAERRAARKGELGLVGGVVIGRPLPPVTVSPGVTQPVTLRPVAALVSAGRRVTEGVTERPAERVTEQAGRPSRLVAEAAGLVVTGDARPRRRGRAMAAESRSRRGVRAAVRRSLDEHRAELARLIESGRLPMDASVREIRDTLGCAQSAATTLWGELRGGAA